MNITQHTKNGLHHSIQMVIDASEIENKIKGKLESLAKTVRMAGFRPGKVPFQVVEKNYKDSTYYDVLETVVHEAVHKAVAHTQASPALTPKVDFVPVGMGKDQSLTVEFEAYPEVEIGNLKDLSFEKLVPDVLEKDVDRFLEGIRQNHALDALTAVERPAQKGDVVTLDFKGSVDGEERAGMASEGYKLVLGSGSFIPGFEDQVIGMKAESQKKILVTFPEDYGNDLGGKEAAFEITVHKVEEPANLKIDDDLAQKEAGKTLEELKSTIRDFLEENYKRTAWNRSKKPILDILSSRYQFPVPGGMVDMEFEYIWNQFQNQVANAKEAQEEELSPEEEKKIKDKYREIANRRVRLGVILSKVASLHKVEVTQDDLSRYFFNLAEEFRIPEKNLKSFFDMYRKNPAKLEQVKSHIFEDKVLQKILDEAQVKEIKVTLEELLKEPEIDPKEIFGE